MAETVKLREWSKDRLYKEFMVSDAGDIASLPTLESEVAVGSVAYYVDPTDGLVVYMLTPGRTWEAI